MRCQANTLEGKRCRRQANEDDDFCFQHSAKEHRYHRERPRKQQRGGVDAGAIIEGVQAVGQALPAAMSAARSVGQSMKQGWSSLKRRFSRGRGQQQPPQPQYYPPQMLPQQMMPYGYMPYYYGGRRRNAGHRRRRRRRGSRYA